MIGINDVDTQSALMSVDCQIIPCDPKMCDPDTCGNKVFTNFLKSPSKLSYGNILSDNSKP